MNLRKNGIDLESLSERAAKYCTPARPAERPGRETLAESGGEPAPAGSHHPSGG
jgi:hypothetical protein